MSNLLPISLNQPEYGTRLRTPTNIQRGAIGGQGLAFPEPWKAGAVHDTFRRLQTTILLPPVITGPIALTAPLATVSSAGILPLAAEIATAPKATVASAGILPLVREIASAPKALVTSVGFNPFIPSQIGEKWRNNVWKPLVETLAAKWEGWHRF